METVSTWICGKVYAGIQALKAGAQLEIDWDADFSSCVTRGVLRSETGWLRPRGRLIAENWGDHYPKSEEHAADLVAGPLFSGDFWGQ